MPTVKELNIQLENQPGTLAKVCRALADRKVNILAFQASTAERRSQLHLIVDNVSTAKTVLDGMSRSRPLNTTPMAPWPISSTISYRPICCFSVCGIATTPTRATSLIARAVLALERRVLGTPARRLG